MARLSRIMETILASNPDLAARVVPGSPHSQESSDASTIRSTFTSARQTVRTAPSIISVRGPSAWLSAVERVLNQSRVYMRASRNMSTNSFQSLATRESNWSQLTQLSLSQISCIAVVCLPVYLDELFNRTPYMDIAPEGNDDIDGGSTTRRPPPEGAHTASVQQRTQLRAPISSDSPEPPSILSGLGLVGAPAAIMSNVVPAPDAMPVTYGLLWGGLPAEELPDYLHDYLGTPNGSDVGLQPQELALPLSRPGSPYILPAISDDLPALPVSPWHSPILGPSPQDADLPESRLGSPYILPAVSDDLPALPLSPWDSPTLEPRRLELALPLSRPGSPYILPAVSDDLPALPISPWHSPILGPSQDADLPESRLGSPYIPPAVSDDLPALLISPWHSPTLGPSPQDADLQDSCPGTPYILPAVSDGLPALPISPWHSPTLGPSPQGADLPDSCPGSPYILPAVSDDLPALPLSPWDSPTLGPRPQELALPISRPGSPCSLPKSDVGGLPALRLSPRDSPTSDVPTTRSFPPTPTISLAPLPYSSNPGEAFFWAKDRPASESEGRGVVTV